MSSLLGLLGSDAPPAVGVATAIGGGTQVDLDNDSLLPTFAPLDVSQGGPSQAARANCHVPPELPEPCAPVPKAAPIAPNTLPFAEGKNGSTAVALASRYVGGPAAVDAPSAASGGPQS